ncbi:MAG: hypothetical protein PHH40_00105 [Candidatus Moranbacteria bacterium]|nr:hypothetical protein [Candidatus Moranbacteria bacterium]MDD3965272.1 hypothetical protein [Candidatus Moranbacteria bacterium]
MILLLSITLFVMTLVFVVLMRPTTMIETVSPLPVSDLPMIQISPEIDQQTSPNPALYSDDADLRIIDEQVRRGVLTPEEAKQRLQEIVKQKSNTVSTTP